MRFSNFNRLVNAVAYIKRAISKAKPAEKMLQINEREIAKMKIFRLIQQEQFPEEIAALQTGKQLPRSSKLLQFDPFLDENGLLRAKGRISKSHLESETKHPILLHWKPHAV